MAQLIKLLDFISRYEMNMYRYPSQYIRLKKQSWSKLKTLWDQGLLENLQTDPMPDSSSEKKSFFEPLRSMFKGKEEEIIEISQETREPTEEEEEEAGLSLDYEFLHIPATEEELKRRFLDRLFDVQLRWASSTIREKSYIDKDLFNEQKLKYFIQRFPDNYLVLYHPVFLIQRAPVELEVIMVSPTETWCITVLEGSDNSVFVGSKERFWIEKHANEEKKALNPLIALNRMEKIVNKIYQSEEIDSPVRKVVLCRNGYFDYPYGPVDTLLVDKRNYESWFSSLRRLSSPIKHVQLKAAQTLLQHCQASYVKRQP